MVFWRHMAIARGGYPPLDSGQAKALLEAFNREGQLYTWNPADADVSYIYRWGDGADHVSARRGPGRDTDFGNGQPLIPSDDALAWARGRLTNPFDALSRASKPYLPEAAMGGWKRLYPYIGTTTVPIS